MNEELQEAKKQLRAAVVAYVRAAITTIGSAEVSAIKGHEYIIFEGVYKGNIIHSESCPCKKGGAK